MRAARDSLDPRLLRAALEAQSFEHLQKVLPHLHEQIIPEHMRETLTRLREQAERLLRGRTFHRAPSKLQPPQKFQPHSPLGGGASPVPAASPSLRRKGSHAVKSCTGTSLPRTPYCEGTSKP